MKQARNARRVVVVCFASRRLFQVSDCCFVSSIVCQLLVTTLEFSSTLLKIQTLQRGFVVLLAFHDLMNHISAFLSRFTDLTRPSNEIHQPTQQRATMPNAERTGMHHNAAKALLHKIDSNKGAFKTAEQRKAAVQSILAANHHTRVTAAGKVKSHDINSMMALADSLSRNVGETTKYPANAATLFEYGSSQLKKSYLKDELHYEAPTALSEVVGVCEYVHWHNFLLTNPG